MSLTTLSMAAILFTAGNKSVRDWSLGKQRLKPRIAVFLCATFSASYYVGLDEALARVVGRESGIPTLFSPAPCLMFFVQ